jgi:acyl-CoA thioesterase FadM
MAYNFVYARHILHRVYRHAFSHQSTSEGVLYHATFSVWTSEGNVEVPCCALIVGEPILQRPEELGFSTHHMPFDWLYGIKEGDNLEARWEFSEQRGFERLSFRVSNATDSGSWLALERNLGPRISHLPPKRRRVRLISQRGVLGV